VQDDLKEFKMNENAMMKMMGRGKAKAAMSKKAAPAKKMAGPKMGKVKTSPKADGVAIKGKTKGKMIAMKMGGKTC
jgi:hypothetical protein